MHGKDQTGGVIIIIKIIWPIIDSLHHSVSKSDEIFCCILSNKSSKLLANCQYCFHYFHFYREGGEEVLFIFLFFKNTQGCLFSSEYFTSLSFSHHLQLPAPNTPVTIILRLVSYQVRIPAMELDQGQEPIDLCQHLSW